MTKLRLTTAALLATAVAVVAAGAFAATSSPRRAQLNVVQTAVAAGQFKTLVSLVKQAGLAKTLSGTGRFTVFAPTDAAFAKVPKATLKQLAANKAKLRAVLLYHVVSGRLTAGEGGEAALREDAERGSCANPRQRRHGLRQRRQGREAECLGLERRHPRHQSSVDSADELTLVRRQARARSAGPSRVIR